jgi:hypothetical protein
LIVGGASATLLLPVESALFITILIVGIFVVDFIARWWRENAWRRRWRERDDD